MFHALSLGVILFVVWLLLSGHTEPLLISLGIASCALVVYIAHRMDVVDREGHPIHVGPRALTYFPWLMWQIVKSNIDVARIILQRQPSISPTMFLVEAGQKTELGHVIYANSITLTPGTITVDVTDGKLEIHALTKEAAAELETGEMDRRVTRMEGAPDTGPREDAA